ncbi:hypothetical protein CCR94_15830 [Rhodoblastus sphagnicola]|uniref:Uncharacterized protein n=1 Tax=Rhodoblastus sphagnicola TaxID=333368 RepID=A0A2S6N3Y7_9HYPH|nr:response regulator [Rhodoblastus sphagnicola]MBB4198917.1 DNA-binding response OmpR family regulator [Rhodoblastus sphagnicola]PPQ29277.1 hypothetical protein CCR94_15830 [Rhodoblastus sphagnicola]
MIENSAELSILVVEDEILIAADLELLLRERGLCVLGPCRALEEALALLKRATPDFAMLDFDLAGESSLPLARELQRRDIPFAFLTGSPGNEEAALEFTSSAIVQKPFDPKDIFALVESLGSEMHPRQSLN